MDESSLYQEAELALVRGDLHRAASLCKLMLEQFPQSARGYHLMSSLFRATGNYQKARDYSQHATELDMFVSGYHLQQGHILYLLKEYDSACLSFKRAADLAPKDAEPLRMTGLCLMQQENFSGAREWLARACELSSPDYTVMDEAQCFIQSGDSEAAEQRLAECVARNPVHAGAYFLLALLALQNGEIARAGDLLHKTLMLDANQPDAHFYLALLLAETGNDRGAADKLLQALQIAPTHIPSLLLWAGVFMKLGDVTAAEKAFAHVIALSPHHLIAWHSLLELLKTQGRREEALARLQEALAQSPTPALTHLRTLYRGDFPQAAPKEFIAAFYDTLLESFEPWMMAGGDVRHVEALVDELRALPQLAGKRYASVLDLGCGVGALTKYMGELAAIRVGVDVSPLMLKIARRHKIFDVVYDMELLDYIHGSETQFDIVAVGGALRWMGNLQPFLGAVRNVMRPDGLLAFVLEKESSTLAYTVASSGRYSHHISYVLDIAGAEGLQLVSHKELMWIAAEEGVIYRHLFIFKKTTLH